MLESRDKYSTTGSETYFIQGKLVFCKGITLLEERCLIYRKSLFLSLRFSYAYTSFVYRVHASKKAYT